MTHNIQRFRGRAEAFFAKLNDGLAAVAVVLAMLVVIVGTYRAVEVAEDSAMVVATMPLGDPPEARPSP